MASNIVNINNTDNNITVTNANQKVIVTDNNTGTSVNVTNPNTPIVQVNTLGPQGSIGAQGPPGSGSTINTSSFATTGSNTFIGNQIISSSSTLFSSSLLITNPNDTQYGIGLNNRSFTPTISSQGPHLGIWVQNNGQAFLGTEYGQTLNIYSNTTNQYSNSAIKVTGSNALITGSLFGTASWAQYVVNGGTINTSAFATTGSNTFIGDQFITGSLNANSQVYEVSFLNGSYNSGSIIINLDQDLITNPNYTRNTNVITVNSSGLYKIYNQCRISVTSGLSGEAELAVFINNNPYRTYFINNIKQNEISTYNFSCVANLNASDTIEFHIYSLTEPFMLDTFSKIYTNVTCSYMTIEKLN
jgi:hypothetical protein